MRIIIIVFSIVLLFGSCKDEDIYRDSRGAITSKPCKWKTKLTEGAWVWSGAIQVPIYEEIFVTASQFGDIAALTGLDIFTGEILWEWGDYIGLDAQNDNLFLDLNDPFVYDESMIFQRGARAYCLNRVNGETIWKEDMDQGFNTELSGLDREFISLGHSEEDTLGLKIHTSFVGDVSTNERWPIPPPPSYEVLEESSSGHAIIIKGSLVEKNGKKYLIAPYGKSGANWYQYPFLGLYNITDDRWEYSEIEVLPGHQRNGHLHFAVVSEDIVVNSVGNHIVANDFWTGENLWNRDMTNNCHYGGFIVENGRVYTITEGVGIYCLDLYSGDLCWSVTASEHHGIAGTTSRIAHHDGVMYFGGLWLTAIDMETGKVLWKIESPDGESFKEVAIYDGAGDPKKALVLTATYQSAYCYEAIKR